MDDRSESPLCSQPSVTIAPEMSRWPALIGGFALSLGAAEFRRELGLPTDRPVVMTGHQAQFWHPGILAKYLAADAFASRSHAAAAWLWVDQDAHAPGMVRYPVRVRAKDGEESLAVRVWNVGGGAEGGDVPTGRCAAFVPEGVPILEAGEVFAAPGVEEGLRAINAALAGHARANSAAEQLASATSDLARPHVGTPGVRVMSLAISRTALFRETVARMRTDPDRCVASYAAALAAHPRERVAALAPGELPLWRIDAPVGSRRQRVTVDDVVSKRVPVEHLVPRALLMTGLLRTAGCDLFIHGTGGGGAGGHEGYDKITEHWLGEWLGVKLAPMAVVTATLRLRIENEGPSAPELRRRQWAAHRARHDPALLNDAHAAARKREFVGRVREARRSSAGAVTVYKEMHKFLDDVRTRHAVELKTLDLQAAHAAARAGDAEIAADRTWAFPLYEADQIAALRRECQ